MRDPGRAANYRQMLMMHNLFWQTWSDGNWRPSATFAPRASGDCGWEWATRLGNSTLVSTGVRSSSAPATPTSAFIIFFFLCVRGKAGCLLTDVHTNPSLRNSCFISISRYNSCFATIRKRRIKQFFRQQNMDQDVCEAEYMAQTRTSVL